jgi:hypothetical protein
MSSQRKTGTRRSRVQFESSRPDQNNKGLAGSVVTPMEPFLYGFSTLKPL